MPSDSIASFFDRAKASRVLFPEQIEQLILQPDIPHADLDSLCHYLEERGAITRFQADAIRSGHGDELNFASYPVIEELGPCPGGVAYRAVPHPSLRTPIELRRFKPASLFPTDTPAALLQRAQLASGLHHPNQVTLLDTGMEGDEAFAAIEPPGDASPLDALVRDIGAMPSFLAAEFGRQAASALRAAHERGLSHGDIRPTHLLVGPMTTKAAADGTIKRRPAPNAALKVSECGLVPVRSAAVLSAPPVDAIPYLPPERLENLAHEPRGDIYSLGASLYHLLAGRPPCIGSVATELLQQVRAGNLTSLSSLRPDVPAGFAELVMQMLSKRPDSRPATMYDVEQSLAPYCRPGSVPVAPASGIVPMAVAHVEEEVPTAEPQHSTVDDWGATNAFSTSHASAEPLPKRRLTQEDKRRTKMWLILGVCLHLSAVALILALVFGFLNSSDPDPEPVPSKKDPVKKKPKSASP